MITEIQRCENDVFVLPVNILTGVARRLLGPHDTLPCVLIHFTDHIYHCLFGESIHAKIIKRKSCEIKDEMAAMMPVNNAP